MASRAAAVPPAGTVATCKGACYCSSSVCSAGATLREVASGGSSGDNNDDAAVSFLGCLEDRSTPMAAQAEADLGLALTRRFPAAMITTDDRGVVLDVSDRAEALLRRHCCGGPGGSWSAGPLASSRPVVRRPLPTTATVAEGKVALSKRSRAAMISPPPTCATCPRRTTVPQWPH